MAMLKALPLGVAVMVLCGCGSVPEVRYPKGSSERTPLNNVLRAFNSPYPEAPHPPSPIALKRFYAEPAATTLMQVISAWARTSGLRVDWKPAIDYPVTPAVSAISEEQLADALGRVQTALAGVAKALEFTVEDGAVTVRELTQAPETGTAHPSAGDRPLAARKVLAEGPARARGAAEIHVSVQFDFGSKHPDPSGNEAILRLAADLQRTGTHRHLLVVGHADRLGGDEMNVLVAFQRAKAVREELRRRLPTFDISAEGRGSSEPLAACPGVATKKVIACLAPNRRATVTGAAQPQG